MTDDVRDQIAAALFAAKQAYDGDFYVVAWEDNYARDEWFALVDALLPVVERIADERAAEAWDAGYAAAELDADEIPYSDRPERATWQPRQNPHRAASLRAASRGETGR